MPGDSNLGVPDSNPPVSNDEGLAPRDRLETSRSLNSEEKIDETSEDGRNASSSESVRFII